MKPALHERTSTSITTAAGVLLSITMGAFIGAVAGAICNPDRPAAPPSGQDWDDLGLFVPTDVAFVLGGFVGGINGLLWSWFVLEGLRRGGRWPGIALIFFPTLFVAVISAEVSGGLVSFGAATLCYLAMSAVGVRLFTPAPSAAGTCTSCGYDLNGLTGVRCPECGNESTLTTTVGRLPE